MKSRIDWDAIYWGQLKPGMTAASRFPDYAVSTHHPSPELLAHIQRLAS